MDVYKPSLRFRKAGLPPSRMLRRAQPPEMIGKVFAYMEGLALVRPKAALQSSSRDSRRLRPLTHLFSAGAAADPVTIVAAPLFPDRHGTPARPPPGCIDRPRTGRVCRERGIVKTTFKGSVRAVDGVRGVVPVAQAPIPAWCSAT